jgi:NAD(P)-dependent dehydrogenase (short-subunit alcohol dehydrogenase family)
MSTLQGAIMADRLRLYGLKSIVTGAANSIGEAIARTLVKHGADVVAADTPDSEIDIVFRRVRGVHGLALDPESPTMADDLRGAAFDHMSGLDILVNNYAHLVDELPADAGEAERSRHLETQRRMIVDTSRAVLSLLKQSPAGRIINIGCLRSTFGMDGETEFTASRNALADLTASQARDSGTFGITVNYVQPGAIMTASSRPVFEADRAFRDQCIASSAARRLGEPIDVAKVVLFLATDDAVFVSGTGIVVDGGVVSGAGGS